MVAIREKQWRAGASFAFDFDKHCSKQTMCSEYIFVHSLKQRYPEYHVAHVDGEDCDFRGFAAAGFAECVLENVGGGGENDDGKANDTFVALVSFRMNPFRLDRKDVPGTFSARTFFARYKLTWQGTEFLYYAVCAANARGHQEDYHFILTPKVTGQQEGGQALTDNHLMPATEKLLQAVGTWTNELHDEVLVFDAAYWKKSRELWKSTESASWDDVILDPETKNGIIEDIEAFFDSQELYREFGVPWKRGVILHGLPGNGKTISIKALMSRLRQRSPDPVPSLYVKSFEDLCAGPQYAIKQIFEWARRTAPCLLIFEDLDSLITDKTRSYFLNEVDGLEANDGILMIGSTNHLDRLDPAIRDRPSRFDRKYFYRLPGPAERAAYARYWKGKVDRNPRVEFPEAACEFIASLTDGFSFAYLKELFIAALLTIARGGKGDEPIPEADTPESLVVVSDNNTDEDESTNEEEDNEDERKKSKKGKAKVKEENKKKKAEELKRKLEAARARREALAQIEVPENLKDSVLVKVIRQQMYTLLREMDNNEIGTKEENKNKVGCDDNFCNSYYMGDDGVAIRAC